MGNSYLQTMDKSKCSGCRACEQACSFNAISMEYDEEGFIYPFIDRENCRDCGKCYKVCPVTNECMKEEIRNVYALQYKDTKALGKSSSGGVFIGIAQKMIEDDGVVFGCVFDKRSKAFIKEATNMDELYNMQGSKYVFSNTENTYSSVKKYLENGKKVFYTGAPCQIAGLISFLGKKYENLYTMDFLCHGMPSEKIFEANICYLEQKYKGQLSEYQFRDKSLKGWGLVTSFVINGKKIYEPGKTNAYFTGFIGGYFNRYSCYSCAFRGRERIADITVGDFWGYKDNEIQSGKGVSFVSVNTDKGNEIFNNIIKPNFKTELSSAEAVGKNNGTLLETRGESIPEVRKTVYNELEKYGYEEIRKKYLKPRKYVLLKIGNMIPQKIRLKLLKVYRRIK